jgi:hypothetical protein
LCCFNDFFPESQMILAKIPHRSVRFGFDDVK